MDETLNFQYWHSHMVRNDFNYVNRIRLGIKMDTLLFLVCGNLLLWVFLSFRFESPFVLKRNYRNEICRKLATMETKSKKCADFRDARFRKTFDFIFLWRPHENI